MADVTDELRALAQETLGLSDERAAQIIAVNRTPSGRNWRISFDDGVTLTARLS